MIMKLFLRIVSDRFLLYEYHYYVNIVNNHLYMDQEDAQEVEHYLNHYLIPEKQRRNL